MTPRGGSNDSRHTRQRGVRPSPKGVDYVIASTPRTGSGLLGAGLAATGVAGRPDDHLRPDRAGPWRREWGISGNPQGVTAMLVAAREATTSRNDVFGTKLHWYQFVHVVRELRRIERENSDEGSSDDPVLLARYLRHPRWVHLRRMDTGAQALSYYRALYSGLWSVPSSGRNRAGLRPDRPDLQQVRWLENMLLAHDARWRGWFARHDIIPLEITYEELDEDYTGTLTRVLGHLGVEADVNPERLLHRQEGDWSAKWLQVYRSRRGRLSPQPPGSAWARLDSLVPATVSATGSATASTRTRGATRRGTSAVATPTIPPAAPRAPRLRYSCVVDAAPMFLYQSLVWVQTLLHLGGRAPGDLVVHVVEGVPDEHVDRLRSLGVDVIEVAPFDPRSPFANKLRQLTSAAFDDVDVAVLSDCDIAFSGDMGRYVPADAIGAKVVDGGFPAYNVWVRLVRLAGLSDRIPLARATQTARWTSALNLNGGLVTVPRQYLPLLADAWPRWLDWVLGQADRFGTKVGHHAFQVSLGLTIAQLGLPVATIPTQLNFSTLPPQTEIDGDDPIALHYHRRLAPDGLIVATGVPSTDRSIDAVNAVLRSSSSQELLAPTLARWREAEVADRS